MFAVCYREDGFADYCGEVFSDTDTQVRVQVCNAFYLILLNQWLLSDEIKEFDKSKCRFFLTEQAAAEATIKANSQFKKT